MSDPFHNMEPFFAFMETFHRQPGAQRSFPDLPGLIVEARAAVTAAKQKPIVVTSAGQVFRLAVDLAGGGFYVANWVIPLAVKIAREVGLRPVEVDLRTLVENMRDNTLDPRFFAKAASNHEPLVVVEYPLLVPPQVIIDGNHRAALRVLKRQFKALGYVLPPDLHLQAMAGEVFRVLYKIHHNFTEVARFMAGETDAVKLLPY